MSLIQLYRSVGKQLKDDPVNSVKQHSQARAHTNFKDSFLCTLRELRGKAGRLKNFSYSSLPRIHFPCHTYIRMLFVLTVGLQKI